MTNKELKTKTLLSKFFIHALLPVLTVPSIFSTAEASFLGEIYLLILAKPMYFHSSGKNKLVELFVTGMLS